VGVLRYRDWTRPEKEEKLNSRAVLFVENRANKQRIKKKG
jgi:hypothetical protein